MLRCLTSAIVQCRGIKQQAKIKWISDDALGLDYALSDELKDAPESVKKIFSVAHLGPKEYKTLVKEALTERVKQHQYDDTTVEFKVAKMTAQIRCLQETMDKHPKNVIAKKACQELIDKRKKTLKLLRQYDYKKFEWLLEKLNIEYKAHPDTYNKLSRKESLKKLTELHCEDVRNKKLDEYRNLLESQQVTDQDIKKVEKQFNEWKIKNEIKQQGKKKKRHLLLEDSE
ncbi:hypothetical protein evm_008457 [Chilo suppressalis]|nr:hypothetical protein evm_008457 [Chilo suppressalis]